MEVFTFCGHYCIWFAIFFNTALLFLKYKLVRVNICRDWFTHIVSAPQIICWSELTMGDWRGLSACVWWPLYETPHNTRRTICAAKHIAFLWDRIWWLLSFKQILLLFEKTLLSAQCNTLFKPFIYIKWMENKSFLWPYGGWVGWSVLLFCCE